MARFEIEVVRLHKSSLYNCKMYIPELVTDFNIDDILKHPDVEDGVLNSYGKHLNVHVYNLDTGENALFNVEKNRA